MKPERKSSIMRRLALILWAWATLILCFVLVLLVNHMLTEGRDPLTALGQEPKPLTPPSGEVPERSPSLGTREIVLFFTDADSHALATETTVIEYSPKTIENCRKALQHLITGPKQEFLLPLMPEQTRIRGLYMRGNGELVLDLSTEMLLEHHRPRSTEMEALMAFGVVNTLMQQQLQGEDELAVKQVRFLFDGGTPQEIFPAHMDLSEPLVQDRRWVKAGYE